MEKVDFDELCKNAYSTDASLKDKDNLWLEVFRLPNWYFIARGSLPYTQPYIAEAEVIEPSTSWLYAFTDSNRATFYAKKNSLFTEDNSPPILKIPNSFELLTWIESLEKEVRGIFFNAEGAGFFVPIEQLMPIWRHLKESFPSDI